MAHRPASLAGLAAGVLSGAPSTIWALTTGRDCLEAARAAGTLVPGFRRRGGLVPGLAAHAAITTVWTLVLAAVLPARGGRAAGAVQGAVAGLGIAAVDLGLLARRYPAIRALPQAPQWADHLAFGAVAGAVLAGRSRVRHPHP